MIQVTVYHVNQESLRQEQVRLYVQSVIVVQNIIVLQTHVSSALLEHSQFLELVVILVLLHYILKKVNVDVIPVVLDYNQLQIKMVVNHVLLEHSLMMKDYVKLAHLVNIHLAMDQFNALHVDAVKRRT